MSRYDKYDPYSGGSRAVLAADFGYTAGKPDRAHADLGKTFAVGLSTTGLLGKLGATFPGFVGLLILTSPKAAGDTVDYMTFGDISDLLDGEILAADTLQAGQALYANPAVATGVLTSVSAAGKYFVGRTHESNATSGRTRLVVRCSFTPMAA